MKHKPTVLIVLDGWGTAPASPTNAISQANTPTFDKLMATCPNALVDASEMSVGLPEKQMGNSEVGHMNLGAGRVVYQSYTRINKAIETGEFNTNPTLLNAIAQLAGGNNALHILGLLSPGGVHSHEDHIAAIIQLAHKQGVRKVYLHAFLDGRDTPPQSAEPSLARFESLFKELGCGAIATLCGRYYAMDRDNNWDRIEPVYTMLTEGTADYSANDSLTALAAAYERGETDEFVKPTVIASEATPKCINEGDAAIFMNFRADRARQLAQAVTAPDFDGFERKHRPVLSSFVTLTQYNDELDVDVAYPPESLDNIFGQVIADQGMRQLRIAETEKYAHVTFFFNGGQEALFDGEERILVDSPKVATYDLKPEMSAPEVTDKLVDAIENQRYDVIICNYANADMVGHTGNLAAATHAIEALDHCLGQLVSAISKVDGQMLITADHGNAEMMLDPESNQPHTAHTLNKVPLIFVGSRSLQLKSGGTLADIAPSLLGLMGIAQPSEMTGHSLIEFS